MKSYSAQIWDGETKVVEIDSLSLAAAREVLPQRSDDRTHGACLVRRRRLHRGLRKGRFSSHGQIRGYNNLAHRHCGGGGRAMTTTGHWIRRYLAFVRLGMYCGAIK